MSTSPNQTWAQLRQSFLRATDESETSVQEAWSHLTEGYRDVLQEGRFPEVMREELRVSIALDQEHPGEFLDYFDLPCDYMTIYSVFNERVGAPINFEPSGWRGRQRFIDRSVPKDTRGKPPLGEVRWFIAQGRRIYLRDTPDQDTTVLLTYRTQPELLDDTFVNEHARTPPQADWSIVWFAAANYYMAHPAVDADGAKSTLYSNRARTRLQKPHNPDEEIEKTAFNRMRVGGYRFTPRSARRRRR